MSTLTAESAVSAAGTVYNVHNTQKPWALQAALGEYHRFEVRSGDQWSADVLAGTHSERSELADLTLWPYGQNVWLAYSLRVSDGPTPADWCLFTQFFSTADEEDAGRSPIMAVLFETTAFRVVTRSDPSEVSTRNPIEVVRYEDLSYPRGTWQRFVFRLRPERTGNGHLDIWRNGTPVYSDDIPVGYNDTTVGPYFKHGIYRAADTQTMVAEFANVEIGARSLASRITNPRPLPVERA